MKTFMASPATIDRKWYVVDATDMTLGRLASEVAKVLEARISLSSLLTSTAVTTLSLSMLEDQSNR